MSKPNTSQTVKFARQRKVLESRLAELFTEARAIEDALGRRSRILPEGRLAMGGATATAAADLEFEEPRGKITRTVWDYIRENPGKTSVEIRDALSMDEVQLATALNTMLRKNKQVNIRGRRGAYKYFAVTTEGAPS